MTTQQTPIRTALSNQLAIVAYTYMQDAAMPQAERLSELLQGEINRHVSPSAMMAAHEHDLRTLWGDRYDSARAIAVEHLGSSPPQPTPAEQAAIAAETEALNRLASKSKPW